MDHSSLDCQMGLKLNLKITAFWNITPYSMAKIYWLFKGKYCLYLQVRRINWDCKKADKHWLFCVDPDVLIAVTLKSTVFRVSMTCSWERSYPAEAGSKLSCFSWFLAWLTIQPWRWRRHVPPNIGLSPIYTVLQVRSLYSSRALLLAWLNFQPWKWRQYVPPKRL
jgi:hypothetical protein